MNLLAWLQQENLPLWISIAEDWDRPWLGRIPGTPIEQILDALIGFPDLRTVVCGAHYSHSTQVRPLLDRLPNCTLELSRYEILGDVERLIDGYGVRRFIYGSFSPRFAMGPILFYLHHIGLSAADLAGVCGGRRTPMLGGGAASGVRLSDEHACAGVGRHGSSGEPQEPGALDEYVS